jgi:hypothetical protein
VSCTAVNRHLVAHEDSSVALPLEEDLAALPQTLSALYRFSRPHTMLGTFISIMSVSALAVVRACTWATCIAIFSATTEAWRQQALCCRSVPAHVGHHECGLAPK